MEDGSTIVADRVVAAPGIAEFAVEPALVRETLAPGQWSHTARTVEFAGLRGRRCLIVGGRQSAFEWAALLAEAGAARVDVVHRHATPEFTASDWSFVDDLLARTRQTRGWFRGLAEDERAAIVQRFWQVGRLQLEPWLADRIAGDGVHLWPHAEAAAIDRGPGEAITVTLGDGTRLETDHVLLATGYRVDMRRVNYLPDELERPTASRSSTRTSRPTSGASTSPASPRRATSARSSASWPAPRPPPRSSARRWRRRITGAPRRTRSTGRSATPRARVSSVKRPPALRAPARGVPRWPASTGRTRGSTSGSAVAQARGRSAGGRRR